MFLSIITPTYNRAYILSKCYESLLSQTCFDFEWIVVDDGSTDDTEKLINRYLQENRVKVKYIKQNNGGKHRAHNTGVLNSSGELCLCLDSDDCLTETAVDEARTFWKNNKNEECIGILAKRGSIRNSEPLCSNWPEELKASTMINLIQKHSFTGDTALFFRTDVLKRNLFTEIEGEKFLSEANLYFDLDKIGKMLLWNRVVYLCEYLHDGLTAKYHKLLRDNPVGTTETYYKQFLLSEGIKQKCKGAILTNIYYSLCSDKARVRINRKDLWLLAMSLPAKLIKKRFLSKFELE